jgi:hypothetical protein
LTFAVSPDPGWPDELVKKIAQSVAQLICQN